MYTLSLSGLLISESGALYPANRSHPLASQVIDSLIQAGAVTEADNGDLAFKAKAGVLAIEGDTPLDSAVLSAYDAIDQAAGTARARYVTVAAGQEMTYISKVVEARTVLAADGQNPVTDIPWTVSQVYINRGSDPVDGDTITSAELVDAATLIVDKAEQWARLGGEIERIRLTAKAQIEVLPSSTTAQRKSSLSKLQTNILPNALAKLGAI